MTSPAEGSAEGARPAGSASLPGSLLVRLRDQDQEAWGRAVQLFYPLVHHWCRRAGLQDGDAADVAQEVFRALAQNVVRFRADEGRHSFRGWLWGITRLQLLAHHRRRGNQPAGAGGTSVQQRFNEIATDPESEWSAAEQEQDRILILRRAVALLRATVEPRTWQVFWRVVVEGHAPAEVAADLGVAVAHVYVIKGRLLRRLRAEFDGLLD
jgi:RNA polymerase sigma-70 factor (ECF subfamily)